MSKKPVLQIALCVVFILSLVLPAIPVRAAELQTLPFANVDAESIEAPAASRLAAPAINWCFAGDMNGWDNSSTPMYDDGSNGDRIAGDGIYSLIMAILTPGTNYWKAVECGGWSNTHPAQNSWVFTGAPMQAVIFTLDTNDYSLNAGMTLLPASNIVNVTGDSLPTSFTAVGSFQGWVNNDPATLMGDMGNGFYQLVYTIPAAGSYIGKAVATGSWNGFSADGRSTDAANISFTTTEANQQVIFLLDSFSGRMLIEPLSIGTGTWCAAGSFNSWAEAGNPLFDDGTNGDLLGGDGVFTADITIPTAGRYEFKVNNCTWDVSYPAANSWLNTTEDNQVVKVSFDTNDHSMDAGLELLPAVNIVHAWDSSNSFTAVGDFQGWNNADPDTGLGMEGRGIYVINNPIATAGAYNFKIVSTGTWDEIGLDNRSIEAVNIPFVTYADEDVVWFYLDYRTGRVGAFPPPPPPDASYDDQVWWAELGHNSRDTLYRTPGGPVTTGTEVTLRMRAAQGDLTEAKLRLYNDRTNAQFILPMTIAHSDGTYDWWEAKVPASAEPTVYWYRFIAIDGTDTDYYEDDAARTMGWGQVFDESPDYSYQLTVYAPDFQTPDWIKNAIVYQIFPDRFRDGDPNNNKPAGTFFYNEPGGTIYRSNTTDWNTYICDPRADTNDPCEGSYSKNFYGGDLVGLTEKLDYLVGLGINTIYLNPIFESPSNHGYDTTDYLSINEMFGTQAEYEALISGLQTNNMRLIVDGVFNHVSSDSKYLDRYGRYTEVGACESQSSEYREWFYFTDVPAGTGPCVGSDGTPNAANYESWWGYDSLPKLNSSNLEVRAWIWDNQDNPETTVAGHWMLTADGWRLDVGADVDPGTTGDPTNDYWEGFRDTVKTVRPEGYITGEEWGIANSWLLGGEWDAVMNYQFSSAVLSLWRDEVFTDNDHNAGSSAGELTPLSPEQFDERILNLFERYNPESVQAMLNLFGSHDTSRALVMLDHNTDQNDPSLYANPNYDWSDAINRLKGAVAVQMTMPGAPTIYYGDEVGLVGPMAYSNGKWEDDPYNRQPYPWLDETGMQPFYTHLQSQAEQDELYDYYATLTAARNAHMALRTGDYRTLLIDNDNKVYAYGRNLPGIDAAIVVINRSDTSQLVSLDVENYLPTGMYLDDILSTSTYMIDDQRYIADISVPANGSAVLVAIVPFASPPDSVIDLMVTGTTASTVTLDWTEVDGVDSYLIYKSHFSGGGYEFIDEVTISEYTNVDLVSGDRVYYIVYGKVNASGLISMPSNEVNALPHYTINWANLQWPSTINHTIGTARTDGIYGQVWIDGATSQPGATPTLIAQVGFGPDSSLPEGNAAWVWSDAVFSTQVGNNDEFVGSLLPEHIGTFDYAYRYTTTNGENWYYADQDGDTYTTDQAGSLVVVASGDTTAPTAPVLSIADWGASFIDLEWTAATDSAGVYAYDIYRSTDDTIFEKIGRAFEPVVTYQDDSVITNQLYYYYVIALDTSFNYSSQSIVVSHIAEAKIVAVTFEVTVPEWTPGTVYLTRFVNPDGTIGGWDAGAEALTKSTDTLWTGTFNILDGTDMEFKFARGTWETGMKGADGNEELANLPITVNYGTDGTQTYTYTVLNWRDPIVISTSPVDGATDVALDTPIVVTWSQAMVAGACPAVWVEPDPTDLVAVTCSFDTATNEMTITPTDGWPGSALIGVGLSGLDDAGGDTQQVSCSLSFTTKNTAPVAAGQDLSTDEDTPLVITLTGSDVDDDPLTFSIWTTPTYGNLSLTFPQVTYTPYSNFSGTDSFTFRASDGTAFSAPATISITIKSLNDAPIANPNNYTINEDTQLVVEAPGLLANVGDPDSSPDSVSVALGADVLHGELLLKQDGSFTYMPDADFNGEDSFTYKAFDGELYSAPATVTITVTPVNDKPVLSPIGPRSGDEGTLITFTATANDVDLPTQTLTFSLVEPVPDGAEIDPETGVFTWTPTVPDVYTLSVQVCDDADPALCDTEVITVTVVLVVVNTPPVAVADAYFTDEHTRLVVAAPGVLDNDTDADEDVLTAELVADAAYGTLDLAADGSFTYLPDADFYGEDFFTYKAFDGTDYSEAITVTITVSEKLPTSFTSYLPVIFR